MLLEIIGGAILIAFGLLAIYFSVENEKNDFQLLVILLVGIIAIVSGGWLILSTIPLITLLAKLAGLILVLAGLFLIISFPGVEEYQPFEMSKTGIFIGLVFLIIGAYLIIF